MPIQTYGIQIRGTAKTSSIRDIQTFRFITLLILTEAPTYVFKLTLYSDLRVTLFPIKPPYLLKYFVKVSVPITIQSLKIFTTTVSL